MVLSYGIKGHGRSVAVASSALGMYLCTPVTATGWLLGTGTDARSVGVHRALVHKEEGVSPCMQTGLRGPSVPSSPQVPRVDVSCNGDADGTVTCKQPFAS